MQNTNVYDPRLIEYAKNIKLYDFFNEEGKEINTIIKEIVLNNCNPVERKKLEL